MQDVATPRVEIAAGAALAVLPRIDAPVHAHHALQLCLARNGTLRLGALDPSVDVTGEGGWMGADVPHSVTCDGPVVQLYLDPESAIGRRLSTHANRTAQPIEAALARGLLAILDERLERPLEPDRLRGLVDEVFQRLDAGIAPEPSAERCATPPPIDSRVRAALSALATREGREWSSEALASRIGVSERRLRQLFADEVGLPMRRYVLWLRVVEATDALRRGATPTDAALQAGFADAAHMSRAFRRLFGTPPAAFARAYLPVPPA